MAWQKGQSGNPRGGPKDKAFADALRLAVNVEHEPDKKKLRVIAEKLVECAIGGESWAIQQVADRLDGKPAQESTVTIDDKRDSTDWTRDELVAFLNDAKASSNGAAKAEGSNREPDSVH
jgi:hypothetical protein